MPNPKALEANKISLHVGQEIAISHLIEMLFELHFQRVDFVYEPGQFAVRGGIVDVYSFAYDIPGSFRWKSAGWTVGTKTGYNAAKEKQQDKNPSYWEKYDTQPIDE